MVESRRFALAAVQSLSDDRRAGPTNMMARTRERFS
jgi:hypothetical protein